MSEARHLTAADIELFYLGRPGHPFGFSLDLAQMSEFMKGAGAMTSSVEGVFNRVFGSLIWVQMNTEANWFGVLPKSSWVRSGWRAWHGFSSVDPATAAIGENDSIPSPVRPDVRTVSSPPRLMVRSFEVTEVLDALATQSTDDVWGSANQVKATEGITFIKTINRALGAKVAENATAWNALEKIDRIVAKAGEQGLTNAQVEVYGLNRATETWANAYVNDSSSLRTISDDLLLELTTNTRKRGAKTTVLMTGYDTYAAIAALYMTFVRYVPMGEKQISVGVNGIQTATGINAGVQVATLRGIPIIQSEDVAVGTGSGELPYIYALDTSDDEGYGLPRLGISVLRPVEYFEARDPVLLNKFVVRGVFRFVGQTVGRFLYGQGKLRDIRS